MAEARNFNLNKVMLHGRLTADPELKYLPSGTPTCRFRICVQSSYRRSNGDAGEDLLFMSCTAWQKTAEFVGEHLKKGSAVLVEGVLKEKSWETRDGQKRSDKELDRVSVEATTWNDEPSASRPSQKPQDSQQDWSEEGPGEQDECPF